MLLKDKVAVVTGSGRGIGRGIAIALAREGATVVINDVGCEVDGRGGADDPAQQVVNEIKALGSDAVTNYDSVADFAAAERIIKTAVEKFGRIDILVNNAGIVRDRSLAKMSEEAFDAVLAVQLTGTIPGIDKDNPPPEMNPELNGPLIAFLGSDKAAHVNGQIFGPRGFGYT